MRHRLTGEGVRDHLPPRDLSDGANQVTDERSAPLRNRGPKHCWKLRTNGQRDLLVKHCWGLRGGYCEKTIRGKTVMMTSTKFSTATSCAASSSKMISGLRS